MDINMINYKIITLLLVIFVALSISGCTDTTAFDTERLSDVGDEYEKHGNTIISDVEKLTYISDKFTSYDEYVVKKNDVTINDIYQITSILEEYVYEYRIVHSHLESFDSFVFQNEEELKELDIDTFKLRQGISDSDIMFQNVIDAMRSRIEYYIDYIDRKEQYNQQKQEELAKIIEMLGLLI
jgi:hypothetical protein